jgi:glycerophosphoryl diester phosphodiesterase/HEAT repeat protein
MYQHRGWFLSFLFREPFLQAGKTMKTYLSLTLLVCGIAIAQAESLRHGPELYCHRTANEDIPENTLASLEQAALLGCDVVEIDLRRTLDGEIVLNHDGLLDRLTDGYGDVEQTSFAELELLDAGSWMAPRFSGLRMARFDDALRLARSLDIRLILDIKTKGIGSDVLRILDREGMTSRVLFNGEWDDIRSMLHSAGDAGNGNVWVQPGVTGLEVEDIHRHGKAVITNFSANGREMDLVSMKAAVAAGVDAINVDYPRLGADAVGRPVESKLHSLVGRAEKSSDADRAETIFALSRYQMPEMQSNFLRWLDGPLPKSSHAAALALLTARPQVRPDQLTLALRSEHAEARANATWLLGMLHAPAVLVKPLLSDSDAIVQLQALRALARTSGTVRKEDILYFFNSGDVSLRGAAALALAHNHSEESAQVIATELQKEIERERSLAQEYVDGGRKKITTEQIQEATLSFRGQMAMMHALSSLRSAEADNVLVHLAFEPTHEFSQMDNVIGCFQLWDRLGDDPTTVSRELSSTNTASANCAEWALIKAGPSVLPAVRIALDSPTTRDRAIQILAWQGDVEALPLLDKMTHADGPSGDLAAWAIEKIKLLRAPTD